MSEEVAAGRTRAIGCSNFSAEQLAEALEASEANGLSRFDVIQPPYSLALPDADEDIFPICEREQVAVTSYSPLGAGFLTGKYTPDRSQFPEGSRYHIVPAHADIYFSERNFKVIELLREQAERSRHDDGPPRPCVGDAPPRRHVHPRRRSQLRPHRQRPRRPRHRHHRRPMDADEKLACLNALSPYANLPAVGVWRSLVAHLHGVQGVAGSNPVTPTSSPSRSHIPLFVLRFNQSSQLFTHAAPVIPAKAGIHKFQPAKNGCITTIQ